MSDADAVAAAKAALNIVYASGDSAASVTQNVSLPAGGADSTTVSWTSDTPEVISMAGAVTRPQGSPVVVTLTATITSHSTSDTKQFILTVQQLCTDADVVAADKAALTIGFGPGDSRFQRDRKYFPVDLGRRRKHDHMVIERTADRVDVRRRYGALGQQRQRHHDCHSRLRLGQRYQRTFP